MTRCDVCGMARPLDDVVTGWCPTCEAFTADTLPGMPPTPACLIARATWRAAAAHADAMPSDLSYRAEHAAWQDYRDACARSADGSAPPCPPRAADATCLP